MKYHKQAKSHIRKSLQAQQDILYQCGYNPFISMFND
jgi:hypothetical protein